jgi:transcriptional regulator with XRE-family HTH domain
MELRAYREKRGITLKDAAAQMRVTVGYLSHLERGLKWPSAPVMHRIQNWSGRRVRPNDLFDKLSPPQLTERSRGQISKRTNGGQHGRQGQGQGQR